MIARVTGPGAVSSRWRSAERLPRPVSGSVTACRRSASWRRCSPITKLDPGDVGPVGGRGQVVNLEVGVDVYLEVAARRPSLWKARRRWRQRGQASRDRRHGRHDGDADAPPPPPLEEGYVQLLPCPCLPSNTWWPPALAVTDPRRDTVGQRARQASPASGWPRAAAGTSSTVRSFRKLKVGARSPARSPGGGRFYDSGRPPAVAACARPPGPSSGWCGAAPLGSPGPPGA